ncbi:TPA: hypothetical protein ACF6G0_002578 [Legionella pneumophila]|nr:hypothetical protein [Legionella pneumophila]HAT9585306.1 hypothetical protein [Legionella pneumophila subsp. pneumophila]HAT1848267.1 hypothetical protein [Legionella pneumophila]HAT2006913.1 hypothetical protein [Legionella pneumophila]HAT2085298.1 hypothetical protein [Legionella pneumophila]
MSTCNVLFVLGAGASMPYGYPSGEQLVKNIIHAIENDKIYFPIDICRGNTNTFKLADYKNKILKLGPIENLNEIPPHSVYGSIDLPHVAPKSNNYFIGVETPLEKIVELSDLKNALNKHPPLSIDEFLRDYPSHNEAGKCMIIYSLLNCENTNLFNLENEANWYKYLMSDIMSCYYENAGKLPNISIITFNYDLSLDYYLGEQIISKPQLSSSEKEQLLLHLKIHHVYGALNEEVENNYGKHWGFENNTFKNFSRFDKALSSVANIYTLHEQLSPQLNFSDLLKQHSKIVFLGYGFHPINNKKIGFPLSKDPLEEQNFFPGKTIYYLNYDGKDLDLDNEFLRIEKECVGQGMGGMSKLPTIRKSHAKCILDAYSRHFKPGKFF